MQAQELARQLCSHCVQRRSYRSLFAVKEVSACENKKTKIYSSYEACLKPEPIRLTAETMLVVIDMQNDFLPTKYDATDTLWTADATSGQWSYGDAFGVADGDQLVNPICELIGQHNGPIAITRDYHPCQHVSFVDVASDASINASDATNMQRPENEKCQGVERKAKSGMFPPHCLFGSKGAMVHEDIAAACRKKGNQVKVFFKGFCPIDSFGAAPYSHNQAQRRISGYPLSGGCLTESGSVVGTGSYTFNNFTFEQESSEGQNRMLELGEMYNTCRPDEYSSLLANSQCMALEHWVSNTNVSNVVVCGLALDFCVLDTARTLKRILGDRNVCITTNLSRPAYVPGLGGYLTTSTDLLAKANGSNVRFVTVDSTGTTDGFAVKR